MTRETEVLHSHLEGVTRLHEKSTSDGITVKIIAVVRILITIGSIGYVLNTYSKDEPFNFQFAAFVSAINATIAFILWTAAFSEKRSCLSLYLLLETPFIVWGIHRLSTTAPKEKADLYATISIVLIGCFVVVVVILGKRYLILKRRDRDARLQSL